MRSTPCWLRAYDQVRRRNRSVPPQTVIVFAPERFPRHGLADPWRALILPAVATIAWAFLLANPAQGATRTWNGGGATNNWNDAANWVGGLIPGVLDVATFDGTSAKNVVVNVNVSVLGIDIGAPYTGTISQPAGSAVTVGATGWSQSGGTFSGGTNAITINGPFALGGGAFTATTGTLSVRGDFTHTAGGIFNASTGTVALTTGAATIDVSSSETFNNLTLTAGTKTIAAGDTLTASGATTLTAGALNGVTGTLAAQGPISLAAGYGGGTATLLINGAGAQTLTGSTTNAAGSLPVLVIDKPSGTLSLAVTAGAFIRTTNNWTYLAGAVDPGTSTVVFAGTQTISGSHTLNDVVFRSALTHTVAAGTTLTVDGTLTLTDGTITTGTVAAQGDLSQASTFDGGTGTLRIDGAGAQVLTGSALLTAGTLPLLVIDKPAGTLTLAGIIRTASNWTYLAGAVDPGTSTVVFAGGTISGSHTLNDVAFRATTTIAAGDTLTASGATTLTAGALNGVTGTLAAQGPISLAAGYGGGTATLLINGAGAQTLTGSTTNAAGSLPVLVIDKPSGTLSLAVTAGAFIRTTNNWTYLAGTVDPGTSTVVFAGTQTISGSHTLNDVVFRSALTHTVAAGTTLTVDGTLTLTDGTITTGTVAAQGDLSQASTFDGGTGTLRIDGAGAQVLTGSALLTAGTLPLLVIDKPAGTLTLAGIIRTASNWTYLAGAVDPGTSTVVFAGGTISGSHTLNDVAFRATTTIAAGDTLTASGATTLTAGALNGVTGTLAAQGPISLAAGYGGGTATLLINGAGAQTLTGSTTNAAGSLPVLVIDKPSGTLSLAVTAGAFIRTTNNWTYLAGTVDPGTSTVVFAGTQTISGSHTLNDVVFRSALTHTVAAGTTLTVDGTLTLTDGTITTGTVAAQGDLSQASTFDGGTGTLRIDGAGAQVLTGSALLTAGTLPLLVIDKPAGTLTLAGIIRTASNWTYLAGAVDPGTSTVVFAGTQTISAAGMAFYDLLVRGGTATLASALDVDHDLTISAGILTTSASSFAITVGRNLAIAGTLTANAGLISVAGDISKTGTFTAGASTILMNGTAGQTISGSAWTMSGLAIDDPVGVNLATDVSVTGTLTLSTGTFAIGANTLTIANPVAGVPTNLLAGATSSLSIVGTAAGIVIPSSVIDLLDLTVDNASGASLAADLTVNGTLNLTNGPIFTGVSTLVVAPGGTVARTNGHVAGNLRKTVPVGSPVALDFEVGDATTYAPVAVSFDTVTFAGTLTASTTPGEHPDVVNAGINPAQDVNRYWTLIDGGIAFDVYRATFTFVAADLDVGTNPLVFVVAKEDATIWTLPSVGTRAPLNTQATGMTTFSHFALGEPETDLALTKDDGVSTVTAGDGVTYTYTMVVANAGPSDATGVVLTDTWPTGFSQGTIAPSQGSCAAIGLGPDFGCALGTIASGASATVLATYTVPADLAAGPQANSARIASDVADPDPANDAASDTDAVVEMADLVVSKTDGLTTVVPGTGSHAYTIAITNDGPSDADAVELSDMVPTAMTAGVPSADLGGDCSASSGNSIFCRLPAGLAVGATWMVTVPYGVEASAATGTAVNTAAVVSDENLVGIVASDATEVTGAADLALTKDDGVSTVTAGDGVTYTYTMVVANAGPSDATGVVLTDTWPTGFSQGTIAPSQGSCAAIGLGPDFGCALGTIASGASATVLATYTVPADLAAGPQANSARIASDVADPDPANDAASDTDAVVEMAASARPDRGAMPDTGALPPGSIGPGGSPMAPAITLFMVGVTVVAAWVWEARRRRRPPRGRRWRDAPPSG